MILRVASPSRTPCNQALNLFSIINRTLEAKGSCELPWEGFISFEERLNERWTWFPGNRFARHQSTFFLAATATWDQDIPRRCDIASERSDVLLNTGVAVTGICYTWAPIPLRALAGDILYSKAWPQTNPQLSSCPPAPRLMRTHQMERMYRPRWGVYLESEWDGGRMKELWEVGKGCRWNMFV